MGKPTISMAIFNSYVSLPEGTRKYRKIYLNNYPGKRPQTVWKVGG